MHLFKTPNAFAVYKPDLLSCTHASTGREKISLIRGRRMPLQLIEPMEHHFCQKQSLKPAGFSRIQISLGGLLVFVKGGVEWNQAIFFLCFFHIVSIHPNARSLSHLPAPLREATHFFPISQSQGHRVYDRCPETCYQSLSIYSANLVDWVCNLSC